MKVPNLPAFEPDLLLFQCPISAQFELLRGWVNNKQIEKQIDIDSTSSYFETAISKRRLVIFTERDERNEVNCRMSFDECFPVDIKVDCFLESQIH